jgi:hypothetical protein
LFKFCSALCNNIFAKSFCKEPKKKIMLFMIHIQFFCLVIFIWKLHSWLIKYNIMMMMCWFYLSHNGIGGVMVSMLISSAVDRGCGSWSVKPKTIKLVDMSTCGLLFQWVITIKIQLSLLVCYKMDIMIISSNVIFSCNDITENFSLKK